MTSKQQNDGPDKLVNLGLKAGDVVRLNGFGASVQKAVVNINGELWVDRRPIENWLSPNWTVISRASDAKPNTHDLSNPEKLTFGEMPDAMKGAMLLAHHRGEVIEIWFLDNGWNGCDAVWSNGAAYRVKPKAPDDIVLGCHIDRDNGLSIAHFDAEFDTHKITIPADENRQPLPSTYTSEDGREIIVESV